MNELQSKLFNMFSWFHELCEENGLRYYMIGGTMLGAYRHGGFIPWDDDIDVGMPRADYEKLEALLRDGSDKRFALETPNTAADDYYYAFSKLYDTSTTLVENTRHKLKRGIYVDIFPLDGIGDTRDEAEKNYSKVYKLHNLLLTRVSGIRKGRKWYKNLAVAVAGIIPNFILNNKKLLLLLVDLCKRCDFDECKWVGNLVGVWRAKEIMPRELFGEPTLYDFEGIRAYGPEKPDEYLTSLYGDWRRLPPAEKQVTHHDYIKCDLNSSYIK